MKINNLIIKLVLLVSFVSSGWGSDFCDVEPSTISAGESFKVYCNLNNNVPNGYKIKVKFEKGITFYKPLLGGPKNWSRNYNSSQVQSNKVYFALFNGDTLVNEFESSLFVIKASTPNPPSVPSKPTTISATDGTYSNKIRISSYSNGAYNYKIYKTTSSTPIGTTTNSYFDHTGLSQGASYSYRVKACNSDGKCSGYSNSNSGSTSAPAIANPNINSLNPTSFTASNNIQSLYINGSNFTSSDRVYINFGSGYQSYSGTGQGVYYNNSSQIRFKFNTTSSGSGTWRVKLRNSAGKYSNERTFEVIPPDSIDAPTLVSLNPAKATVGESQTFTLFGRNFPSIIKLELEGGACGSTTRISSTVAKVTCTPPSSGNKRLHVAVGGSAISGSSAFFYVNITDSDTQDETPKVKAVSTDSDTRLSWATLEGSFTWKEAIGKCEDLVSNGSSSWRTPNINELYSIVDTSKSSKFVKSSIGGVDNKAYWSSTTNSSNFTQAMSVNFTDSSSYSQTPSKTDKHGAICVK